MFQDSGFGFRVPDFRCRVLYSGVRVPGSVFHVSWFKRRVPCSGFRVPNSGCRVRGFGIATLNPKLSFPETTLGQMAPPRSGRVQEYLQIQAALQRGVDFWEVSFALMLSPG